MTETTEKQLKGPLATAVKSIQLQITKYETRKKELIDRSGRLLQKAQDLDKEIKGLEEHIEKLKGND